MITGSEYVYVPVEANAVTPMAEGGSGGADAGGGTTFVNWIEGRELEGGGIIGRGWVKAVGLPNTPFVSPHDTEDAILKHIEKYKDLDKIFEEWRSVYDPMEQYVFLLAAADEKFYGNTDSEGCIGSQLI